MRLRKSVIRWTLIALAGVLCLGLGFTVAGYRYLSQDLPSLASLQTIETPVKTLVFAANGDTLKEFFHQNRTIVPLSRIPRALQEATIAIEDRRFYSHYGLDMRRLGRVILDNLTGRGRPGASTLTMQLARNLFPKLLPNQKLITRKLREMIVALQIEQVYTKDEILGMYLNQIYMGRGTYGMEAAARTYFGKDIWEVEPAEATMLAGIIQLPEYYSPFRHLDRAYTRRSTVLESMIGQGYLTRAEGEEVGRTEVVVRSAPESRTTDSLGAYFVEEVRQELERTYGVEGLYSRGLRVTTTLNPKYQQWIEDAVETHMVAMEAEAEYDFTRAVYDSLTAEVDTLGSVDYLQCAALLMDVRTGAVLGMVGGRSYADYKFNVATQAPRQPGSIFKPFVYLTALKQGYTPASILMDSPLLIDTGVSLWRPRNFSGRFEGPVSLRYALTRSINAPTARLYLDFGVAPVIETVRDLGIERSLPRVPALFLGAGELTLWDIVPAYGVFANHGVRVEPFLITRVESAEGEILQEARIRQREVLDPAYAYMMCNLLQTTIREGTGASARWRGFRKTGGGKTGTTNDCTNAWFCGFTPSFVAGVWVGFDTPVTMGNGKTGAHMALPVWANFMGKITDEKGEEAFVEPTAIIHRTICAHSGMLATSQCDSLREEVFLPDAQPREVCDLHGGQIHDFSGFDKDFQTLDRNDEDDEF